MTDILRITPENLDIAHLSSALQGFFKGKPWNELYICPTCKPCDDFGPTYTWGEDQTPRCETCGRDRDFDLFWSPDRTRLYVNQNPAAFGRLVTIDGQMAAWVWGYPKDPGHYYIDTVAIMSTAKKSLGVLKVMKLFREFITELTSLGYTTISTRTHEHARHIRILLYTLGFRPGEYSSEDPMRRYWVRNPVNP